MRVLACVFVLVGMVAGFPLGNLKIPDFPREKVSIMEISTKSGGEKKLPKQTSKLFTKCTFTREWSSTPPDKYQTIMYRIS